MPLKPGTRLRQYEILGLLGAGGMGEVYRARDIRLGREVAIKLLREDLVSDPDRLARLEREARALAALSHPHIAALHGYEEEDAKSFLVMELLSGETLQNRLGRGAVPVDEVLEVGEQIADALSRAHRSGIVHRDLKPANVMLTRDGVKLLDFGIAKHLAPAGTDAEAPTMTAPMTQAGTLLGTLPYMAPEQVEGREVDPRTDIFALGAMLYEMVTGRRAFLEETQARLIAAILKASPPPMAAPDREVPPALEWVVRRCLARDPEERWHSAHDVRLELLRIAESELAGGRGGERKGPGTAAGRAAGWRPAAGWIAAGTLALTLVGVVLLRDGSERATEAGTAARPLQRVVIDPGAKVVDRAVLSPDGATLAYLAGESPHELEVHVRPLSSLEATRIDGTQGAEVLAFSPDGRRLAFAREGELFTISITGGERELLASDAMPWPVAWEEDGFLYYSSDDHLWRVSETGGAPSAVRVFGGARRADHDADLLPDRRTLLFATWAEPRTAEVNELGIHDFVNGESRLLQIAGTNPRFVPPRFLLFSKGLAIRAAVFDPRTLEVAEPIRTLEQGLQQTPRYVAAIATFATSRSGDLAFVLGEGDGAKELVWVERDGAVRLVTEERRDYSAARISPDGAAVAVAVEEGSGSQRPQSVWMLDLATLALQKPQFSADYVSPGPWMPDSRSLTLVSDREGPLNLFLQRADFGAAAVRIVPSPEVQIPWDWSPDGRYLLFEDGRKPGLWVYDRETSEAVPPADGEPIVRGAQFHPRGRWIAYTTHPFEYRERAESHIWVRSFPGPGTPFQVGTEPGHGPKWSPAGDELYFHGDTHIMAVPVEERGDHLITGKAVPLFEDRSFRHATPGIGTFAVHPDGRFLMIRASSVVPRPRIVVVQNALTRLEELFPGQN